MNNSKEEPTSDRKTEMSSNNGETSLFNIRKHRNTSRIHNKKRGLK